MLSEKSERNLADHELVEKLGELGGAVARSRGALGVSFAASVLKTDVVHDTIYIAKDLKESMELVTCYFKEHGELIDTSEYSDVPIVSACVGSGCWNLNPAVLCVEFLVQSDNSTLLNITGYAKEGLIKQKTAIKAIEGLKHSLS